ncbi:MAG: PaaI family thioesterase [Hyphomicrobiales bacterium]|nr:PaaI family thioesterase [Hyphomicrobiales bacterium]
MNKPLFDQLITNSAMQDWLAFFAGDEKGKYILQFKDHHIGNPMIRSIHGGVTASLIEMCAEHMILAELGNHTSVQLVSSSLDYLRVSKDTDIHARANIVRIGKRLAFVDVWCWQDDENTPIARGTCTLRLDS